MAEDITKLPKWAQWKIKNLEQEIASKRAAMDAYATFSANEKS